MVRAIHQQFPMWNRIKITRKMITEIGEI